MIVVIADDLSGAAELANVALNHGLSADVQTRFDASLSRADVLCVSTESRSLPVETAIARVQEMARRVALQHPEFVYKKCDSLLRGHVVAEARAVATAQGFSRVLLVPANPSRGRTIRDGLYWVGGHRIAESSIAADPEYPRATSRVSELLGDTTGVVVPDINSSEEMDVFAQTLDRRTLAAGAADFFAAILRGQGLSPVAPSAFPSAHSALLVCGSRTSWLDRQRQCEARSIPVFTLARDRQSAWYRLVGDAMDKRRFVCTGIGDVIGEPGELLGQLAEAAAHLLRNAWGIDRVLLEGGATAAAICQRLGIDHFHARPSPGRGVGAMVRYGTEQTTYLIKPGSYDWPAAAWDLVTP